jgi:DNA-binding HxlR family transcriptional regulator
VKVEYSLTEKGKDFQAVLAQMYAWAQKWGASQEQSASNHHGLFEIHH